MKKFFTIMMVVIMLLGIAFTIVNLASVKSEADTEVIKGTFVLLGGEIRCMDDGTECIIRP